MIIDIILTVLFIIAAIWGAYKGGVKIIASIASFVVAIVLAYVFASTVGNYIRTTDVGMKIESAIQERILISNEQETETDEMLPETENNEEDSNAITKIEQVVGDKVGDIVNENKELLANKIIETVFYGIGFLITFIGVKFALFIIFLIVEFIFELPVLKSFNRIIGCALESILMLVKAWIVLGLISFIEPLAIMQGLTNLIGESVVTKFLYEHNIIINLVINKII